MAEGNPLHHLELIVHARQLEMPLRMPEGSYTRELLEKGLTFVGGKISEEAGEVVQALAVGGENEVNNEVADLIYHITVGMVGAGKGSWDGVFTVLEQRRKQD